MIIIIKIMMMMMMMMMILLLLLLLLLLLKIKIIIAFKGTIRDSDNLLTAPRTVSNTYAEVAWAHLCANLVQHIER